MTRSIDGPLVIFSLRAYEEKKDVKRLIISSVDECFRLVHVFNSVHYYFSSYNEMAILISTSLFGVKRGLPHLLTLNFP